MAAAISVTPMTCIEAMIVPASISAKTRLGQAAADAVDRRDVRVERGEQQLLVQEEDEDQRDRRDTTPMAIRSWFVTPRMLPNRAASKLRVKRAVLADQRDAEREAGRGDDADGRVRADLAPP